MRADGIAAIGKGCFGALAIGCVLLCLAPGSNAESLILESSEERPFWTKWKGLRLAEVGLDLNDAVFAADRRHGWVVGDDGVILATGDGGRTWTAEDSGVGFHLNAIHLGTTTGRKWIVGDSGGILTKQAGAAAWTKQRSGVEVGLRSVHATADEKLVWAVGDDGTIVISNNYDVNWTPQESGVENNLKSVYVGIQPGQAWIAGTNGLILHTDSNGSEWSSLETGTELKLLSIHFSADGDQGLVVGVDGVVLRSDDSGKSWNERLSGVYAPLSAVRLSPDGRQGWAVGDGGVIISTVDGGDSWTPQTSGVHQDLHAIDLSADGRRGWTAGADGVLLSTDDGGATWTLLRKGIAARIKLRAADLSADGQHGWLAGRKGVILTSTDGGGTWTAQDSGTCADLEGLHMSGDNRHGWIVGERGTILVTSDGGRSWHERYAETTGNLNAVSGDAAGEHGWAVGDCGTVFGTTDGGDSWSKAHTGTDADLHAIHAGGGGEWGWAVGDDGVMVATRDGGSTWVLQAGVTDDDLLSVHFSSDGIFGWVAGEDGVILATRDGGVSWIRQISGTGEDLRYIHFADDHRRGWAVGDSGTIFTTDTGGNAWTRRKSNTDHDLATAHFSADGLLGWAVGENGAITRTYDGGKTWTAQTTVPKSDHVGVYFGSGGRAGWVVSDNGDLIVTGSGENRWTGVNERPRIRPKAIHVAADGIRIWAVGDDGEIFTSDDGWQTKTKRLAAMRMGLTAVHGASDNLQLWSVGDSGNILASTDGGDDWAKQDSDTDIDLTGVQVREVDDGLSVWAVGSDGTVLAFTQSSQRWEVQGPVTDSDLKDIHVAPDGQHAWAAGTGGTILATINGGKDWTVRHEGMAHFLNAVVVADDRRHGWAVGRKGAILATGDGGETWVKQDSGSDFTLEAVDVAGSGGGDVYGWAVGSGNTILVPEQHNGAPYLTSLSAEQLADGSALLEFAAQDAEGDRIHADGIEICDLQKEIPNCEDLDLEIPVGQDNRWSIEWDPDTTKKAKVDSGSELRFAVTLSDDKGEFPFKHATQTFWEFAVWYREIWRQHPEQVLGAASVPGLLLLYVLALLGIFLLNPVFLIRLSRILSYDVKPRSPPAKPVQLLLVALHTIALRHLACHPRTVQAWTRRYADKRASFAEMPPVIRSRYLEEPKVLDAWVKRRVARARDAIDSKTTVHTRSVVVEMPVTLDIRDKHEVSTSKVEIVAMARKAFRRERGLVAVVGPGGGGKTTLAARIARWTCTENKEEKIFEHATIPVWIESDTSDLVGDVVTELRTMVGEAGVDREIVGVLLIAKRVVVIVDGLTERNDETRSHIYGVYGTKVPVNALLLTGREKPLMERAAIFRPSLVSKETIGRFIQEYARSGHPDTELHQRTHDVIARRALSIVAQRGKRVPMTPLLARLFVDSAVAVIERDGGFDPDKYVKSVPETIIDYLFRVNPQDDDAPNRLENKLMILVAKALSRAALKPNFVPRDLHPRDVADAIEVAKEMYRETGRTTDVDARTVERRLVDNEFVEKHVSAGGEYLRIRFDPVAEYLAAIDLAEECGSSSERWEVLLKIMQGENFAGEGFLVSLFDVVTTYTERYGIPEDVRRRLEVLLPDPPGEGG